MRETIVGPGVDCREGSDALLAWSALQISQVAAFVWWWNPPTPSQPTKQTRVRRTARSRAREWDITGSNPGAGSAVPARGGARRHRGRRQIAENATANPYARPRLFRRPRR